MAAQREYPEELRDRAVKMVLGQAVCQPEKRKVDSSILSLTTSYGLASSALTSADACRPFGACNRRVTITARA